MPRPRLPIPNNALPRLVLLMPILVSLPMFLPNPWRVPPVRRGIVRYLPKYRHWESRASAHGMRTPPRQCTLAEMVENARGMASERRRGRKGIED